MRIPPTLHYTGYKLAPGREVAALMGMQYLGTGGISLWYYSSRFSLFQTVARMVDWSHAYYCLLVIPGKLSLVEDKIAPWREVSWMMG